MCETPHIGRSGPDGQRMDRRIRSPKDFNDALTEIVTRLTSLQVFRWGCSSSPMPVSVFNALKKANKLEALSLSLKLERSDIRLCE